MPIRNLSMYSGANWRIRGRVTFKSDRRKFKNSRGEGELFSVDLKDASGEIRASFFGKAVTKFYDTLQMNQIYTFARGQVKAANKRYYSKNEYEITFPENADIVFQPGDDQTIGRVEYNFEPISSISQKNVNDQLDVCTVIHEVRPCQMITIKKNTPDEQEKPKRDLILIDESNTTVEFTIWGDKAQDENAFQPGTVMFMKNGRVNEWQEKRSLSNGGGTQYETHVVDDPRAVRLQAWYNSQSRSMLPAPTALSGSFTGVGNMSSARRHTIAEAQEEDVYIGAEGGAPGGDGQTRDAFVHILSPVTVLSIYHDRPVFYHACQQMVEGKGGDGRCNKKVEIHGDGQHMCSANHITNQAKARYLLNCRVADSTGTTQLSCFDEAGVKLMGGLTGDQMAELWARRDVDPAAGDEIEEIFRKAYWMRWSVKMRSKKDNFNDEERIKSQVLDIYPYDYVKEGMQYAKDLKEAFNY